MAPSGVGSTPQLLGVTPSFMLSVQFNPVTNSGMEADTAWQVAMIVVAPRYAMTFLYALEALALSWLKSFSSTYAGYVLDAIFELKKKSPRWKMARTGNGQAGRQAGRKAGIKGFPSH